MRSHAGSMSVVQYHVGVIFTTSSPLLRPMITVRCAPIVPAGNSPAASCIRGYGRGDFTALRDQVVDGAAGPRRRGSPSAGFELHPSRKGHRRTSYDLHRLPETHQLEDHVASHAATRSRTRRSRPASTRRWSDNNANGSPSGDEARAAAGPVDRRAAALARIEHRARCSEVNRDLRPETRRRSSRRLHPRRATQRRRRGSGPDSACTAHSRRRARGINTRSVVAATPMGVSSAEFPASTPAFAGSYTTRSDEIEHQDAE